MAVDRGNFAKAILWTALGLVIIGTLATWNRPISEDKIVGKLVQNRGFDEIEIHADHTYIHRFQKNAKLVVQSGSWEMEEKEGASWITFNRFQSASSWDERGGYYYAEIDNSLWGRVRITVDPDLGIYYKKIFP